MVLGADLLLCSGSVVSSILGVVWCGVVGVAAEYNLKSCELKEVRLRREATAFVFVFIVFPH